MKKKIIYYVLLAFFAIVFLVCAINLISYFIGSLQHQQKYDDIYNMKPSYTSSSPIPGSSIIPSTTNPFGSVHVGSGSTEPTPPPSTAQTIMPEMMDLYNTNKHYVGWIEIEGTKVDWPVVQTPNTIEWINYYLYRDFYGNDDMRGTIYVREACDVFAPSDHITIYGHNMADHSMFGELCDYWYRSHYENHKYFSFDTLYERHNYEIFAVYRTTANEGGFEYFKVKDFADEAQFDAFVKTCKDLSLYDIDVDPEYGDKLVSLSTCDEHLPNGRLVIVGRRVD